MNKRKIEKLNEVKAACARLMSLCDLAIEHLSESTEFGGHVYQTSRSQHFAAAKRASMDLTRLLSSMRKPNL